MVSDDRLQKVRPEGCPSRSPVLQEIITLKQKPWNRNGSRVFFFNSAVNLTQARRLTKRMSEPVLCYWFTIKNQTFTALSKDSIKLSFIF